MNFESQLTISPSSSLIKIGNQKVAVQMKNLLSDHTIFNQRVKGFHMNFKGPDVFFLHQKLEDLSEKLSEDIQRLAVRVMTGILPIHSSYKSLQYNNLEEIIADNSDEENVIHVVNGLRKLIVASRRTAIEAEDENDIISAKLLRRLVFELENELWVFTMLAKY